MTMLCIRCLATWWEIGKKWPKACPFCPSKDVRPKTPFTDGEEA